MSRGQVAFVTGISGQDGSYMAEALLRADFEVHGLIRCARKGAGRRPEYLTRLFRDVVLHRGDIRDGSELRQIMRHVKPNRVYHLSGPHAPATTDVSADFLEPIVTSTEAMLSAIADTTPDCRFFLAGTSYMLRGANSAPQIEAMDFSPIDSYGCAKVRAHRIVERFRHERRVFACTGILYNHESPRRRPEFVTRKITRSVARIKAGLDQHLSIGNLEARRDWGYAPDYVRAMQAMLEHTEPRDFLIATGETHSVREFVKVAFSRVGLRYEDHVMIDPDLFRPEGSTQMCGSVALIRRTLGWRSRKAFYDIVGEMVDYDVEMIRAEQTGNN